jgi:hypothetical protein
MILFYIYARLQTLNTCPEFWVVSHTKIKRLYRSQNVIPSWNSHKIKRLSQFVKYIANYLCNLEYMHIYKIISYLNLFLQSHHHRLRDLQLRIPDKYLKFAIDWKKKYHTSICSKVQYKIVESSKIDTPNN